jgi:hypothetical protein
MSSRSVTTVAPKKWGIEWKRYRFEDHVIGKLGPDGQKGIASHHQCRVILLVASA